MLSLYFVLSFAGYPKTSQVVIVNDSLNHVHVVLKVNRDGTERVLTQEQILATFLEDDVDFPENPKEFSIEPETFVLTPRGFMRISVGYNLVIRTANQSL